MDKNRCLFRRARSAGNLHLAFIIVPQPGTQSLIASFSGASWYYYSLSWQICFFTCFQVHWSLTDLMRK
jgi:hypothetical protein